MAARLRRTMLLRYGFTIGGCSIPSGINYKEIDNRPCRRIGDQRQDIEHLPALSLGVHPHSDRPALAERHRLRHIHSCPSLTCIHLVYPESILADVLYCKFSVQHRSGLDHPELYRRGFELRQRSRPLLRFTQGRKILFDKSLHRQYFRILPAVHDHRECKRGLAPLLSFRAAGIHHAGYADLGSCRHGGRSHGDRQARSHIGKTHLNSPAGGIGHLHFHTAG